MYDIPAVAAELGLAPAELEEILAVFCTELTDMLTAMEASVRQADYVQLAQLCHSLKGTAANLRVKEISSAAEALEYGAKRLETAAVTGLLPILRQEAVQFIALIHNSSVCPGCPDK